MIPVNRDTLMMIATIVCAVGIVFLFKEMNKTKKEMDTFRTFSEQVIRQLNPPPSSAPRDEVEPEDEPEVVKEDKTPE